MVKKFVRKAIGRAEEKEGLQLNFRYAEIPCDDKCVVPANIQGTQKQRGQLAHLINEMCKSDAGRDVIETALKNNFVFVFDTSVPDAYGFADPENKICAMNPMFNESDLITTMAHELRHVHQFEAPITSKCNPYEADTKSNLMLSKVMEADAEAYGCFVSWQLKEQGKETPWNTFKRDFPEIAEPFEKTLKENEGKPDAMDKARTAAFFGWFENRDRRVGYDDSHVDFLREIGAQNLDKKLKSFSVVKMVTDLCAENGKSYFAADPKTVDTDRYVAVDKRTKDRLDIFFDKYYKCGGKRDVSLDKMPVLEPRHFGQPIPVAKSAEAKKASLSARQERVAKQMKQRKQPSLSALAAKKKMSGR